eukprot:TRINITY_DN5138_c0_g1_i4.p1 TRINITY_DN5138_c0_g1~~TRINITY_DN5138_c0_g1_i4.p1  ORF type:complete len:1072 (+),score=218.09 TRINITY_DN5138_c0_g1_i4:48-3263(+)
MSSPHPRTWRPQREAALPLALHRTHETPPMMSVAHMHTALTRFVEALPRDHSYASLHSTHQTRLADIIEWAEATDFTDDQLISRAVLHDCAFYETSSLGESSLHLLAWSVVSDQEDKFSYVNLVDLCLSTNAEQPHRLALVFPHRVIKCAFASSAPNMTLFYVVTEELTYRFDIAINMEVNPAKRAKYFIPSDSFITAIQQYNILDDCVAFTFHQGRKPVFGTSLPSNDFAIAFQDGTLAIPIFENDERMVFFSRSVNRTLLGRFVSSITGSTNYQIISISSIGVQSELFLVGLCTDSRLRIWDHATQECVREESLPFLFSAQTAIQSGEMSCWLKPSHQDCQDAFNLLVTYSDGFRTRHCIVSGTYEPTTSEKFLLTCSPENIFPEHAIDVAFTGQQIYVLHDTLHTRPALWTADWNEELGSLCWVPVAPLAHFSSHFDEEPMPTQENQTTAYGSMEEKLVNKARLYGMDTLRAAVGKSLRAIEVEELDFLQTDCPNYIVNTAVAVYKARLARTLDPEDASAVNPAQDIYQNLVELTSACLRPRCLRIDASLDLIVLVRANHISIIRQTVGMESFLDIVSAAESPNPDDALRVEAALWNEFGVGNHQINRDEGMLFIQLNIQAWRDYGCHQKIAAYFAHNTTQSQEVLKDLLALLQFNLRGDLSSALQSLHPTRVMELYKFHRVPAELAMMDQIEMDAPTDFAVTSWLSYFLVCDGISKYIQEVTDVLSLIIYAYAFESHQARTNLLELSGRASQLIDLYSRFLAFSWATTAPYQNPAIHGKRPKQSNSQHSWPPRHFYTDQSRFIDQLWPKLLQAHECSFGNVSGQSISNFSQQLSSQALYIMINRASSIVLTVLYEQNWPSAGLEILRFINASAAEYHCFSGFYYLLLNDGNNAAFHFEKVDSRSAIENVDFTSHGPRLPYALENTRGRLSDVITRLSLSIQPYRQENLHLYYLEAVVNGFASIQESEIALDFARRMLARDTLQENQAIVLPFEIQKMIFKYSLQVKDYRCALDILEQYADWVQRSMTHAHPDIYDIQPEPNGRSKVNDMLQTYIIAACYEENLKVRN